MEYIEKFEKIAIKRFNLFLFTMQHALEVVNDCEKTGTRIYGIDGFKLHDDGRIQPFMEHSVDYSYAQDEYAVYDLAKAFLEQKKNLGLVFEIVVEG